VAEADVKFVVPQGIGDSVWALHKIRAIAERIGDGRVEVYLAGSGAHEIESRALDFVRRFSFVESAAMRPWSIRREGHPPVSPEGYYNYLEDGMYEFAGERVCALMPNAPLERGINLAAWLPQYPINWDIWRYFRIPDEERASGLSLVPDQDYAVFYLGPLNGNTVDGHNRGALWPPRDWIELGRRLHAEFGLSIVAVGAPYDAPYFDLMIGPRLDGDAPYWLNLIGRTNIGQLYSITSRARLVISYQSGVGIVSTYLGTPTGIFWRPKGDSISPSTYLSFEESMASAWVPPARLPVHLPLIYRRHGIDYILDEIRSRGWV
jgi:hypothetical protein